MNLATIRRHTQILCSRLQAVVDKTSEVIRRFPLGSRSDLAQLQGASMLLMVCNFTRVLRRTRQWILPAIAELIMQNCTMPQN